MVTKEKDKVKITQNKVIKVVPVLRNKGFVNQSHDSYFMNDGAVAKYTVPVNIKTKVLVDPLSEYSDSQKEALAYELAIPIERFNVRAKDCYWKRKTVRIDKNGLVLDLKRIDGLIDFLILQSNTDLVAPSYDERFEKGTYRFCFLDEDRQYEKTSITQEDKIKAYAQFDTIKNSTDKMYDFLLVYWLGESSAVKPSKDFSRERMVSEVGKVVDEKTSKFVEIITDDDYEIKVIIQKGVLSRVLFKSGNLYGFKGSNPIGDLATTIKYLDPEGQNQAEYIKLKEGINSSNI